MTTAAQTHVGTVTDTYARPAPLVPIGHVHPAARPLPPALTGPAGLRSAAYALRRRWVIAAAGLTVAALAAAGVWLFLPLPKLTVWSLLHVQSTPPSIISPTIDSRSDFTTYRATQATLLKSRLV